ncbi:ABC transporter permease [Actinoallomurus bryophytorum]|uniref:Transport permease protein n=1 Tax=Actinoallomurus bryophytorum TaxID=1490222 RepID=A0A543CCG9_9ACTN|nr:ABC transporter permease [Actinoallomurus bryophytorum]TQL94793.1 ABC-2 type transport system permease protein [Actinoallomurus bryophytorum]
MTHATHARYDMDGGEPRPFPAELRAARMVWRREMLHFVRDRTGTLVALLQPLLFLFVLGVGLGRLLALAGGGPAADYLTFLFPGVLVMAAQPAAISVGASIVWDRESGFLREMLVAPVRRGTLLAGKCLGGATVATCQGTVVLASAGLIHVPYRPVLFALLLAELALTALAMTVLGAVVAVVIRRARTFTTVLSVLMTPLIFLSGLMFPVAAMPTWMSWLTLADPLTYAVDAMRATIGAYRPPRTSSALFEPVAWGGVHPSPPLELAVVAVFTAIALTVAARRFGRTG